MKYFMTIAVLMNSFFALSQSLPNMGFENWETIGTYTEPVEWNTANECAAIISIVSVTESNDAHSGSSSARLETIDFISALKVNGVITTATMICDPSNPGQVGGYSETARPDSMVFWAKYAPVDADTAYCQVLFFGPGGDTDTISNDKFNVVGTVSDWTRFSFPINWWTAENPTMASVLFSSSWGNGNLNQGFEGSLFLVDDAEWKSGAICEETQQSVEIIGSQSVQPFTSYNYVIDLPPAGYTITWSEENGSIVSGQGTNFVEIFWDASGWGEVIATISNDTCTFADTLFVCDANQTPQIIGQTNIQPFTSYTYVIDLPPTGYTITWSEENGTIISGQGTNFVEIFWDASGWGEVIATLSSGNNCSVTDTLLVGSIPTGVLQQPLQQTRISPNPSTGIFTVNVPDQTNIQTSVFDALGKLVTTSSEIGTFNLDLSEVPVGIYTLRLDTESESLTKKLVRE